MVIIQSSNGLVGGVRAIVHMSGQQPLEPRWNRLDHWVRVHLPILCGVGILSAVITGLVTTPVRRVEGYSPAQPVPFSHQMHVGTMRIDCRYCHIGVETGRHASIPASSICMNCHSVAALDRPGVQLLRASYAANRPIFWRRIHRLPDFVYFSHDVHILAKIDCEYCHGKVREMEVVSQAVSLSMGSCLGCHRNVQERVPGIAPGLVGPENCSACHR